MRNRPRERYVVLHRIAEQLDAAQFADILRQEGIPVRLIGPSHVVDMGIVPGFAAEWRIEVPEHLVIAGAEILHAFMSDVEVENDEKGDEVPWELCEDD